MSIASSQSGLILLPDQARVLGGYELLEALGGGPSYRVERARPLASGTREQVAIKRLRSPESEASARARLLREARVGLGLRAPNLVRVLQIHDEPELFVVMEYVEGATLHELLAAGAGPEGLRCVLPMFVDALHGLSALHAYRSEEGAPGFLVHQAPTLRHMLVGFDGTTRLIDLSSVHGPLCGAPVLAPAEVLAPEQFRASAQLDPRCDIYVIGTALRAALRHFGVDESPGRESALTRADQAALLAIVERATQPRRSDRFWSAEEMAFALSALAREAGLWAGPESVGAWARSAATQRQGSDDKLGVLQFASDPWAGDELTKVWQPPHELDALLHPEGDGEPERASVERTRQVSMRAARTAPLPRVESEPGLQIREAPSVGSWRALLAGAVVGTLLVALSWHARAPKAHTVVSRSVAKAQRSEPPRTPEVAPHVSAAPAVALAAPSATAQPARAPGSPHARSSTPRVDRALLARTPGQERGSVAEYAVPEAAPLPLEVSLEESEIPQNPY